MQKKWLKSLKENINKIWRIFRDKKEKKEHLYYKKVTTKQ